MTTLTAQLPDLANATATPGALASVTSNDSTIGVGAVVGVVVVTAVLLYARRRA